MPSQTHSLHSRPPIKSDLPFRKGRDGRADHCANNGIACEEERENSDAIKPTFHTLLSQVARTSFPSVVNSPPLRQRAPQKHCSLSPETKPPFRKKLQVALQYLNTVHAVSFCSNHHCMASLRCVFSCQHNHNLFLRLPSEATSPRSDLPEADRTDSGIARDTEGGHEHANKGTEELKCTA